MADREYLVDKSYEHLDSYVKYADKKASVLLSGLLAFLALYVNFIFSVSEQWNTSFNIVSGLTILLGLIAITISGFVVYPRTPDKERGFFLWESILDRNTPEDYYDDLKSLDDYEVVEEVVWQNYQLAKVADSKYSLIRLSIIIGSSSFVSAALSIAIILCNM
ncbi:Pycsar system effector family protein [Halostagnicola kamekurae]|uniref:Pycsar system effector family protein n=1 Tax=Halostagnicola kamekurae TaxID=619731 RepID=UPI00111454C0|nr:Pycsar system effector family protein [Halostagnicola kamekurae]